MIAAAAISIIVTESLLACMPEGQREGERETKERTNNEREERNADRRFHLRKAACSLASKPREIIDRWMRRGVATKKSLLGSIGKGRGSISCYHRLSIVDVYNSSMN